MDKKYCDSCGEQITGKPNEVHLKAREGLDGAVWGTFEVCDKCFKEIYKKTVFARQFDPNTVEGTLREIHFDAEVLQTADNEEKERILDKYR